MKRGRSKGDHEAARAKIVEAATAVILRLGIKHASLSEISREMGNTTGILRHYFSDKEDLLLYAKNWLFDRSYERVRNATNDKEGIEKLRAMALSELPCDADSINRFRLLSIFNGYAIGDRRLVRMQHKRDLRHVAFFAEVIAALQKEHELPSSLDARQEALGIVAMIDGLADHVIMNPKAWPVKALQELLSRYVYSLQRLAA